MHVTSIAMLFCLHTQNSTEIGQSAAELWPKTIFLNGGRQFGLRRAAAFVSSLIHLLLLIFKILEEFRRHQECEFFFFVLVLLLKLLS